MKLIFSISQGKLIILSKGNYDIIEASSGNKECMNTFSKNCESASFKGPIPIGSYYILPNELSDPNFIGDIVRNFRPDSPGDWGDFRVRIHPHSTTKTFGRDNFFIHGGSIKGSAGCIDVGGGISGTDKTEKLKTLIKETNEYINLEVLP